MNQKQTSGKSFDEALFAAFKESHDIFCSQCEHRDQDLTEVFAEWRAKWSRIHEIGETKES